MPLLHVSASKTYSTHSSHIRSPPFHPSNPRMPFPLHLDGKLTVKPNFLLWLKFDLCLCNLLSDLCLISDFTAGRSPSPSSCHSGHYVWSLKHTELVFAPGPLHLFFLPGTSVPRLSHDFFLPVTEDSAQMLPFHRDFPRPAHPNLLALPVTVGHHPV